jgi:hypothetical protein
MALSCEGPMSHRIRRFRYFGKRSDLPCSGISMGLWLPNNQARPFGSPFMPLDFKGFPMPQGEWKRVPRGLKRAVL